MLHGTFHLSVAITLTIILDTAPLAVEGGSTGVAPSQEVTVSTLAGQLVGGPPDVDGLRRAVPVPVTITFTVEPPVSVLYTEVCPTRHLVSVDVTLVAASGGVWVTCVHGLRSGTLPESITVTDTVLVLHTAVGVVEDRLAAVRLAVDVTGVAASVRVNQTGIFSFLRRTVIGTITATLAVKSVAIPTFERERGICRICFIVQHAVSTLLGTRPSCMLLGTHPGTITAALTLVPFPASFTVPELRIASISIPAHFAFSASVRTRPPSRLWRTRPRSITEALARIVCYAVFGVGKLSIARVFPAIHVTFATYIVTRPSVAAVWTGEGASTRAVTVCPLVATVSMYEVCVSQLDLSIYITRRARPPVQIDTSAPALFTHFLVSVSVTVPFTLAITETTVPFSTFVSIFEICVWVFHSAIRDVALFAPRIRASKTTACSTASSPRTTARIRTPQNGRG